MTFRLKRRLQLPQRSYLKRLLNTFIMESSDLVRHQIIKRLMAQHTENVADAAINLWEPMTTRIISLVGEGGFNSLYARSAFLSQLAFPWLTASSPPAHRQLTASSPPAHRQLTASSPPSQTDLRFAELKICFEGQTPEQAREANSLLLITFTDILAALIGEHLTTSILRSAWGNGASDWLDKELKK